MERIHRAMATCDGMDCPEACHFRKLQREQPAKWSAYLDPKLPATVGPSKARRNCRHLGDATGRQVECTQCKSRVSLKVFACARHGECTKARPVDGLACCATCPDYERATASDTVQVESTSGGIGDLMLTVAFAGGLDAVLPAARVVVTCQSWAVPWVALFWPGDDISVEQLAAPRLLCNHNAPAFGEFTAKGQSRLEYWQEQFGVRAAMPPCRVPPSEEAIPFAGRVLIAPFAAFPERTWPVENWLEIERRLLDAGFFCAILHKEEDERLGRFQSGKLIGRSPEFVASVMRYAVAVAGNDSGMAHLAGALKMPAVAVCSAASDRNIMGLWPTVATVGDKGRVATVDDVYEAILRQTQPTDFPSSRFLNTLMPEDRWREHAWSPIYAALWRTVKELAPRTVVEIGVRAGQGAWTILDAAPGARLVGYDVEELDASRDMAVPGATAHARAILAGHDAEIIAADSRTLERIPPCDLCYVDGDHTEEGAYADLCLAERSGAKTILVDDCAHLEGVRRAVARFLGEHPHRRARFIPSQTGLYLIQAT